MNPYIIETMIKERHRQELQDAERRRLIALYQANNPPKRAKIVVALADLLIKMGQKLKQRYVEEVEITVRV